MCSVFPACSKAFDTCAQEAHANALLSKAEKSADSLRSLRLLKNPMIAVEVLWNSSPLMNSYENDVRLQNLHDASIGRPALLMKAEKSADCFRILRLLKNLMIAVEFLWNSSQPMNSYGSDVSLHNLHDARFGRPATNGILFPRSFLGPPRCPARRMQKVQNGHTKRSYPCSRLVMVL